MTTQLFKKSLSLLSLMVVGLLTHSTAQAAEKWWGPEWTIRKSITIDTTAEGGAITDPLGSAAVLVRLHEGNFQFLSAKDDGSDIRFVAADGKTLLPYHIEKYDSLMNEAFVWVKVPDLKPGEKKSFWLYYGNAGEKAVRVEDAKATYDADTQFIYHLTEHGSAPADSSGLGNAAETTGIPADGALIGTGLRLNGRTPIIVPNTDSLAWTENQSLTWSAWVKPTVLQPNAILFSRRDGANAFVVGLNNDIPYVEITNASGVQQTAPGSPIEVNTWRHLAVIADGSKVTLFLDGQIYATLNTTIPAIASAFAIGGDATNPQATGLAGEVDELNLSKIARPAGLLRLAAVAQGGTADTDKLLQFGDDEANGGGVNHTLEHLSLFGDIANNMMFDGWVVIFFCMIMVVVGWTVAIRKFLYLNKIKKGTEEFLKQWKEVSSDLTALDHSDANSVKSLGGADEETQELMHESPLYQIYHIGSEEISNRLTKKGGFTGLSGRSIQAIKASLDSGLTREVHRLNNGLIFLTISIAGGPYVGLLGTVMGVMITFAVIAKSGEVDVNSIAPGIASALLATVAGLVVAIPALFVYSYLNTRIKDVISNMTMFIDEFIAKMAEFYPAPGETSVPVARVEMEKPTPAK